MPFVPATNVLQTEVLQRLDGQRIENVLYFQSSQAITLAAVNTLHATIQQWIEDFLAPSRSFNLTFVGLYSTDLTTQSSPTYSTTFPAPIAGSDTDPSLPNNVALSVQFRTNARGRTSRGRNFATGIGEGEVVANTVSTNFVNSLITAYQELFFSILTAPWTPVVLSRFENGNPRVSGLARNITGVAVVDTVVDSQRRRLPGRGD